MARTKKSEDKEVIEQTEEAVETQAAETPVEEAVAETADSEKEKTPKEKKSFKDIQQNFSTQVDNFRNGGKPLLWTIILFDWIQQLLKYGTDKVTRTVHEAFVIHCLFCLPLKFLCNKNACSALD